MVAARDIDNRPATSVLSRGLQLARFSWANLSTFAADLLPKGLYARALIIIIAPIVVLEGVIAFVFMERHWEAVTRRLSKQPRVYFGADRSLRHGARRYAAGAADEHGAGEAEPFDAGFAVCDLPRRDPSRF